MAEQLTIVVDTREQRPFTFSKSRGVKGSIRKTLKAGDYSILGYEHLIAIERKSPMDIFGTLGKGHKRFQKEIRKAINMEYFAIIVECSYMDVITKNFKDSHRTKMGGDIIIEILYTLKFKYGIDVIFAQDRNEATAIIRQIFKSYHKWKNNPPLAKIGGDNTWMIRQILLWRKKSTAAQYSKASK